MRPADPARTRGFTLIELLTALLVLSILGLMTFRGLGTVLDTRDHVKAEAEKWRRMELFFARFAADVRLSAPRPVRSGSGTAVAWLGRPAASADPLLEFTRFSSSDAGDTARRIGYRLNDTHQVELWLWPGLDLAPTVAPERFNVLSDVKEFELRYLDPRLEWAGHWPVAPGDPPIPLAVRLRVVLASGEELVRVFSLRS